MGLAVILVSDSQDRVLVFFLWIKLAIIWLHSNYAILYLSVILEGKKHLAILMLSKHMASINTHMALFNNTLAEVSTNYPQH